jgi:formylglycine-generating enzyme required for sulfatase activity
LNLTCRIAGKDIETCVVGTSSEDKTDALVYDLAGNVSEWVKTDTPERVAKGGNFFLGTDAVIATGRTVHPAGYAHPTIGFRCVSD